MKAITLWQPWASLIAVGAKPFEFRRWAAPKSLVGERIAIHAGARPVRMSEVRALIVGLRSGKNYGALNELTAMEMLERVRGNPQAIPLSHIVCTARLGEPKKANLLLTLSGTPFLNDSDRDDEFNFGWPMLDVQPLQPPVPARGAQGFWDWVP